MLKNVCFKELLWSDFCIIDFELVLQSLCQNWGTYPKMLQCQRLPSWWYFSGLALNGTSQGWYHEGGMYPSPLKVSKKEQMKKYEVFSCNKVIISIFSVWASMTIFSTKKGKLLGGGDFVQRGYFLKYGVWICVALKTPFLHPPDKLQDPYFLIFQFSKALIQPRITNFYKFQAPKP